MDDETEWMRRAADGDRQAFSRIVRRNQASLLRFAMRMTGDAEAAQDLVQEAFLRLWRRRLAYRPETQLSTLLFQITRNLCRDHYRTVRPAEALLEAAGESLEAECGRRALADAIRRAVMELPEAQRAVFVLSEYEGRAYREIAHLLECPLGTVASRKAAAVETLRRKLAGWNAD